MLFVFHSRGSNGDAQRRSRGHSLRGQGQGLEKILGQGQGPTFRGQTLSRPRTGMVEAKAKDQGHNFLNYGRQIFYYF